MKQRESITVRLVNGRTRELRASEINSCEQLNEQTVRVGLDCGHWIDVVDEVSEFTDCCGRSCRGGLSSQLADMFVLADPPKASTV